MEEFLRSMEKLFLEFHIKLLQGSLYLPQTVFQQHLVSDVSAPQYMGTRFAVMQKPQNHTVSLRMI